MIYSREASLIQTASARAVQAAAGNKLIVDSIASFPDSPPNGFHWYVQNCTMVGVDPNGAVTPITSVLSGLFLCPAGTRSPALATAVATAGDRENLIGLPLDSAGGFWRQGVAGQTFVAATTIFPFIVPAGCFLRAIWDGGPGALPSNGSRLTLNWTFFQRENSSCPQEVRTC